MTLLALIGANLKMIFRNRQSLFWALAFPLIFCGVFGLFNLDAPPETTIATVDYARDPTSMRIIDRLRQVETFTLQADKDETSAREALRDGDLEFLLILPDGLEEAVQARRPSGIQIFYDEGDPVSGIVLGMIQSALNEVNQGLTQAPTLLNLSPQGIHAQQLDYFDFLLPGFVGLGVMTYSIIGIASVMATYREQKILKRILVTPLRVRTFFAAMIIAYLILSLVQTAVILATGVWLLGGTILGNYIYLAILVLAGNSVFLCLGFIVGSFAKNVSAASGLGNAISMPMMFLSGVFFPTDTLPSILPTAVRALPLSPMMTGMRGVALDAKSLMDFPVELAILGLWIVAAGFIATRVFRFE